MSRLGRRGLTLLELVISLAITSMIGLAIASMMGVTSAGVSTHRDTRSVMLRAHMAQTRLASYAGPSRCVLDLRDDRMVLWFQDRRRSDTVHSTEIRWLLFDEDAGELHVHWVEFPGHWAAATRDLNDLEHAANADWWLILATCQSQGWTRSMAMVDGLAGLRFDGDRESALDCRHLELMLSFEGDSGPVQVPVPATIVDHKPPAGS